MLVHLQIRDFAIIDAVELELAAGLTALTGETGAGKSMLVDAVMLAIGGRAMVDVVRHGASRAEIAATFDVTGNAAAREWLDAQAFDAEDELVLRRVIGAGGRSRCDVNGETLPAQAVRERRIPQCRKTYGIPFRASTFLGARKDPEGEA